MSTETIIISKLTKPINIEGTGFQHISVVLDEADQKIEKIRTGVLKPFITHSEKINNRVGGFFEGEQIVIAARTGMGKSAFLNWLLDAMADEKLNPGKNAIFLYWSVEMKAWRQIIRMYSHNTYKDYELGLGKAMTVKDILSYKDPIQQEALIRLFEIRKTLADKPIFFRDQSATAKGWSSVVNKVQLANPEFTIINLWDHTRLGLKANEKSEEERITAFMSEGMILKSNIDCINFFLSQMNRNIESSAGGQEIGQRPPVSSDIFGADAVQQFADTVFAAHRPDFYNVKLYLKQYETKDLFALHVLKQRDGWTGLLRLKHNLKYNTFMDWADNDEEDESDC